MTNKLMIAFMLLTLGYADISFNYNGKFSHFFALRNSNNKVLNIPFRMLDLNTSIQLGYNFEVKSLLSAQYHNTIDDYFNTKNITGEVRELYGTYYFNSGEISFGRKLFTLGSVDENSPIDHFNPYNYYYLLIGGTDKKVSVDALSFEFYLGENYQISGAYSPDHNTNYYPMNDPEYSLSLPTTPNWYEYLDNKGSSHESYLSLRRSSNNNEFVLSYLRGFDRVFSLSGFTVHEYTGFCNELAGNPFFPTCIEPGDVLFPGGNGTFLNPDKWFSYRLTESLNIGVVHLFNDFTIRTDFAIFHSFDRYNKNDYSNFQHTQDIVLDTENDPFGNWYNAFHEGIDIDGDDIYDEFYAPLEEDVIYYQLTFQLELPLPNDWQFNMQYFQYKLGSYKINEYTFDDTEININQVVLNLKDVINSNGDLFVPGFGSSMATLTKKSILLGFQKYSLDNRLKSSFTSFFDLDEGKGKLISLEVEYELNDNLNILFGGTKIVGDESIVSESLVDPGYTFNLMEDFSHNRIQFNYYF